MGEKKTTPITINDVEYTYEDMTIIHLYPLCFGIGLKST